MLTLTGIDEIMAYVGKELGVSAWKEVTQESVDRFADVTGDHQFIHVDAERARRTPFGTTIAHGFYTLSLGPVFAAQIFRFVGFDLTVNYGLNRVRFPAPLKVGSKVRMRVRLASAHEIPGGVQLVNEETFESEGSEKPVCVAESVIRSYTADGTSR